MMTVFLKDMPGKGFWQKRICGIKIFWGMIVMFKVLLATDGSQSSFKAVDKTIQLVKNMKAEVTVLTVVHDAPFISFMTVCPLNIWWLCKKH